MKERRGSGLFRMTDRQSAENVLRERLTAKYLLNGTEGESFCGVSPRTPTARKRYSTKCLSPVWRPYFPERRGNSADDEWVTVRQVIYDLLPDLRKPLASIKRESDSENTLINDPEFREMEKTMPTKSSFLFYSSGQRAQVTR
ncbi:MAG: hypothetical protein MZV63_47645 [Marinilabiliales bacterium]|nr:hypothetical protein [Marinilabiliales bacterium]